jgi:hypothetical protein
MDFLHSQPFQLGQNRLPSFQTIPVRPKPTSETPSHSGQNRLPPFQAILVRPKPTSFIPNHFSQVKTNFRNSKPFRPKPISSILANIGNKSNLSLQCCSCHRTIQFLFLLLLSLSGFSFRKWIRPTPP